MNRDEQTTGVIRPRYPLARLSPAKTDVRVLTIPRACVLDPDPGPVLQELEGMSATAALAERWEGRVTFVFAGWTHDPRITAEIPEIRDYFAALTEAWPYWLYFGEHAEQRHRPWTRTGHGGALDKARAPRSRA
jgi:hypothetical protein